jgi:hypothetical protein
MPWSLTARRHGLPIAAVPGGGYRRDWQQLIPLHLSLFEEAKKPAPFLFVTLPALTNNKAALGPPLLYTLLIPGTAPSCPLVGKRLPPFRRGPPASGVHPACAAASADRRRTRRRSR